jgi:hypothetical protein
MSRVLVALCLSSLVMSGCTKEAPKADEPVKADMPAATPAADTKPAKPDKNAPPPPPDTCVVLDKLLQEPPVYVAGKSVVLTQLMKPCVTRDGQRGYDEATPWLAMGIPCTGPGGRVELKGNHYTNPKMVSLMFTTDCAMDPAQRETVKTVVTEAFALPPKAKLMAYTPFVVQFWELPGMTDADTGFAVELRSGPALDGGWKKLRDGETIKVWLYGRENAWVQGNKFYMVEGDVKLDGRHTFRLKVDSVKVLGEDEIAAVKTRCEALRPTRNCSEVF